MAAPTIQAKGGLSALASGTTQSPTIPTHQADDILLAFVANNGGQTITLSAGWSWVPLTAGGDANVGDANFRGGVAWRRATGAGHTITFTHSAAGSSTIGHYAFVYVIRGCRTSGNPWDDVVTNGAPTNSNRPKHGANTSVTADCLYLASCLIDDDNAWNNTVRTGFTEEDNNGSTTGGDFLYYIISKVLSTAQTQAQEDFVNTPFTMAASDYWVTFSLTLASVALAAAVESWGAVTA